MSNEELIIVRTAEEFALLLEYIKPFEYVTIDSETTGLHSDAQIIGFSICCEDNVAFYVVVKEYDSNTQTLINVISQPEPFFMALKGKRLVGHNIQFDCGKILANYKIDLFDDIDTDTLVLAHLLNENDRVGLKELAAKMFGDTATDEQFKMKESIVKNGGKVTKSEYELYKGDSELIAKYGAKDALLTWKVFKALVPQLTDDLYKFFYEDETMPLLKGPTKDLNTVGLKVDTQKLKKLRSELETSIAESQAFIANEIWPHVKDKYPGPTPKKTFNIGSGQQIAWLLFEKLGEDFNTLTDGGRELCKRLGIQVPYTRKARWEFVRLVKHHKSQPGIKDPWQYMCTDEDALSLYSKKYKWIEKLLEQKKNQKILNTYVIGIQEKVEYEIVHPSFKQHGTTSGRYSSLQPNFQNLPRDDKRVKACVVSRPGKVFVGADYSQLEPRVFASVSQDPRLLECFAKGEDFYSVVGIPMFEAYDCSTFKDAPNSFAKQHPDLRNIAKQFALATAYGTTAFRQAQATGKTMDECQELIDKYFEAYPSVKKMMTDSHDMVKKNGYVLSLYGRPRRIPKAMDLEKIYGKSGKMPYEARNMLNLAMNHRCQSSAASIVNRSAIRLSKTLKEQNLNAKLVLTVHDSLIVECDESEANTVSAILKDCMENTVTLPGVALVAIPVISKDLSKQ
jgi:DNA polymerase-1